MKGYVLTREIEKKVNIDRKRLEYRIRRLIDKGLISDNDIVEITKDNREEFEKVNNVGIGSGPIHRAYNKKAVEIIINEVKKHNIIEKEIIVNDDKIENKITNDIQESIKKLEDYSSIYKKLGFGKMISAEKALNAINNNIDILIHAEKTLNEMRKDRYENKREMFVAGINKAVINTSSDDFRQAYRYFEKEFYKRTGIHISMLKHHSDDNRYTYFIEKFGKWDVAFDIINDMIILKRKVKK